jgi:L-threonylcarbamoyladenylate synthase
MKVFHTGSLSERDFDWIGSVIRAGGVIGFPTDTAYGLGADPFNEAAVRRIFEIKGRAETKPILLLVNAAALVEDIAQTNSAFYAVTEKYWPGPLTVILPARPVVPDLVTAKTGTVGVRWPSASFAERLVKSIGHPITATSANRSGNQASVTAAEVRKQLGDSLSLLIDGGVLPWRTGSTLLDLTRDTPVLLREGPISCESLQEFFHGRIRTDYL